MKMSGKFRGFLILKDFGCKSFLRESVRFACMDVQKVFLMRVWVYEAYFLGKIAVFGDKVRIWMRGWDCMEMKGQ